MNVLACSLADLAPSSATRVVLADSTGAEHAIALVRIDDDVYAIGDRCSHADVSLSAGTVWSDECELECPKHGSAFNLLDGRPQSFPATHPVAVYEVARAGDRVVITLP